MRALIQRVQSASVIIDEKTHASIQQGLLAFIAVEKKDDEKFADKLLEKIVNYRVFSDTQGKMNLSLQDTKGSLLLVSQFTLAADTHKGLRPSFSSAATPEQARHLYAYFVEQALIKHAATQSGVFAADMQVALINDGPVTFLLEV